MAASERRLGDQRPNQDKSMSRRRRVTASTLFCAWGATWQRRGGQRAVLLEPQLQLAVAVCFDTATASPTVLWAGRRPSCQRTNTAKSTCSVAVVGVHPLFHTELPQPLLLT